MAIKNALQSLGQGLKSLWSTNYGPVVRVPKRDYEDIGKVNAALLPLLTLGLAAAIWVGWRSSAVGPVLLWAMACLAVGATVGFLFGIPRSGGKLPAQTTHKDWAKSGSREASTSTEHGNEGVRPNTNLEEVSDWLTKILVGLSLVNLKSIEGKVMSISRNAAASLSATPTDADISAATALVVGFAVVGFLCGYLYTRLFLQGAFSRSNDESWRKVLNDELSSTVPETVPQSGEPSVPSPSDRQSAQRIFQVAPADRPDEVLAPLRALAIEYERVRSEMPYGNERTRKMSDIAKGMKKLGFVAAPLLPQLTQSTSPGERLAAVMTLQMKFDPDYINWLANRLVEEPAFCGYQAASALLARIRIVGGPEQQRIKSSIEAALKKRTELGLEPEASRDNLVEQILSY